MAFNFDTFKQIFGNNGPVMPPQGGMTGGTLPPTTKDNFNLPNGGGSINLQGSTTPTAVPQGNPQMAANSQAQGPFAGTPSANTPTTGTGTPGGNVMPQSEDEVASMLNSAMYGVTPDSGTQMSPTQQYFKLKGQQADDRANGTGLYFIDPTKAFSPDQIRQQYNAADQAYGAQMDALAPEALAGTKPELTAGQASMFNSIVSQRNRSPLIMAANRIPILQDSIKNIRDNPSDAALQLNLAYSYIQALDTYQSAVREGELALVNSIDSKVGQIGNFITQMTNGQIVRPEVAKQIADAAEKIVNTINDGARSADTSFDSQARAVGLGDVWSEYTGGFTPSYKKSNSSDQTGDDWEW